MRASDLQGKRVCSEDGKTLGRVSEIHLKAGQLSYLTVGKRALLQRFAATRGGKRVPWEKVVRVTQKAVVVR
jgi:sporulation protein YlmC with PRC-barrel domain